MGKPVFSIISQFIPIFIGWHACVVGLFIGFMPRREAGALYAGTVIWGLGDLIMGLPQLDVEIKAMIQLGSIAELLINITPIKPEPWYWAPYLGLALKIVLVLLIIALIYESGKIIKWIYEHKQLAAITIASFTPFILITIYAAIIKPSATASSDEIIAFAHNSLLGGYLILGAWLILVGPFLGTLFFRWLGIYKRIPSIS